MALNIIQIPLFLFIRGVKIAFSASCFHAASAIVFLTEVHTDNLAGYKILQLQQILGKFCINKRGTKKLRLMEFGSSDHTYLYKVYHSAMSPALCEN